MDIEESDVEIHSIDLTNDRPFSGWWDLVLP